MLGAICQSISTCIATELVGILLGAAFFKMVLRIIDAERESNSLSGSTHTNKCLFEKVASVKSKGSCKALGLLVRFVFS